MGNGALPHGPSYRAHPRLYPSDGLLRVTNRELFGAQRTCRELVERVDPTLLTLSGPEGPEMPQRIEPLI